MTINEKETTETSLSISKRTKGYILSSLLIIVVFVAMNIVGFFLNVMDIIGLSILFFIFIILTLSIIAYSDRLETISVEKWGRIFRKYSHLTGGIVMIGFAILSPIELSWICFNFFIMFLLHEIFYVKLNISGIYTKTLIFIGRLERNNNNNPQNPKLFFPTLWLLGAISIIGLFGQLITIAAIITFALGDSLSTIIGERIGHHKLPYNKTKSIEGSLVFFTISFLGVLCAYHLANQTAWIPALVAGLSGCLIESVIPSKFWLDDNFAVPVSVGSLLFLVQMI
ncbi:MAG: hypothetical protein ACTSYB_08205 [Candidatus Helarchaeota archaeon]